jgi:VCBS repeat-containing protein
LATALSSALSLTQTGTNDGTIVWNFSLANNLTQYLAAGETVTAVYTITVTDDSATGNNTATQMSPWSSPAPMTHRRSRLLM